MGKVQVDNKAGPRGSASRLTRPATWLERANVIATRSG